jgi:hypothetical protein
MSCHVHWLGKQSYPCAGVESCVKKIHEKPLSWRAYAAVEVWRDAPHDDWCPAVLEITETLGEKLRDRALIGEVWKVYRVRTDGKHRECSGHLESVGRPAPIDSRGWIETALYRLYGTVQIAWGVSPILPPPVKLEPRKADRPTGAVIQTAESKPCSKEEMKEFLNRARAGLRSPKEVVP